MSSCQPLIFEALIVPHRSLKLRGVATLASALIGVSALIALRFWLMGAWPVAIVSCLEIPLLILLLAINQRRAAANELIMLDSHEFRVVRTGASGKRQEVLLPAAWLRIQLESSKGNPRVLLSSQGRAFEVGAFLHEQERLSLFDALSEAIYRLNNPRFDNPQLRQD